MAVTSTAVRGLSADDVQTIRDTLAAGRNPKVMFTEAAGQIAGQTGQVVELTDPTSSEEWLVVRFGRDQLPFSPTDLSISRRGASGRRAGHKADRDAGSTPVPEFKLDQPPVPAPRDNVSAGRPPARAAGSQAGASGAAVERKPAGPAQAKPAPVHGRPPPMDDRPAPMDDRPARRASRAARPKGPARLTVTLAYADGTWTVAATQGSKALAKPYVMRPAEALKLVGLLDVPGVHEAVEQILAGERAEAESQAQRLRAELAEIEARLAELREVG